MKIVKKNDKFFWRDFALTNAGVFLVTIFFVLIRYYKYALVVACFALLFNVYIGLDEHFRIKKNEKNDYKVNEEEKSEEVLENEK